jgi:hypothetical protein
MKSALLIGLNYTGTPYQLNGCVNDVNNMRAVLLANGYLPENITTLVDTERIVPNKKNILQQLQTILTNNKNTEVLIYYSGHGSQVRDQNGDEQGGRDSCIVPSDFQVNGFIIDDDLGKLLEQIKCKCILLFDSCNSGTVCDLPFSFSYLKNNTFVLKKNNSMKLSNPNIYMMSGCRDNQYSEESNVNGTYGGAFTNAFLKRFTPQKPLITLYAEICSMLPRQQPLFSSSSFTVPQARNPMFSLNKMKLNN